ncbi:MAG: DUF4838 domain-containing protein, partial [Armatimonadetes bacterium]|nr:DUF4838 domain-containing protein [Candidatus Hippobium faecium]
QKENESFYNDLKAWGEISQNINVWDYIANFNNYVILHPDFHVLQKNLQIMKNNKVTQVFEQGDGSNDSNVLGDYKRYIVSKLLWNCDLDVLKETKTFMKYYYGPAGDSMEKFLDYINSVAPNISARVEMNNYSSNPYFTAENWIKSFELLNKALKQAKRGKYYDRVKRDFLCLYAGYILSDLEIQEKVTASGVIPYKNITEGLNEMNDFLPAHGVRNYNEGMKWEEGIYANAIPKKQGTVPEICKDLKDEDWAEFQQDNLPVVFGGEDYGKIVDDSKASDGKAVWINPKYLDWYTQKSLSLFYYDKTLKSADIYATYRIDPLDKFGKIATCYIWNPVNKEILKYEFDYTGDADKEYKTVKIGEIDFQKTDSSSMLYFCGAGVTDVAKGFYLDRVIFVFHR